MTEKQEHLEIPIGSDGKVTLYIYPLSKNAELYDVPYSEFCEARYQLIEGQTYLYEFDSPEGTCYQFQELDGIISRHASTRHPNQGTITTGIYVGQLKIQVIELKTGAHYPDVKLEIRSIKSDYESDYQRMLDEIALYYADLVLQQGSPVTQHLEIDKNTSARTLYQRFSFVRSVVDSEAFSEAIHKIISNPVKKWTDANLERSIVGVKRLSRKNIRQIASESDRIPLPPSMKSGLPKGLDSVPRRIVIEYKRDTTDNQENQFIKFVLRTFVNFCSDLMEMQNATERLKSEAAATIENLLGYLNHQFFRQISMPTHLNMNSPVLQRKEGYREVLQAWLLFDLAAKLNWTGGEDVYEAGKKNVATLYEFWLFFKLMELISEFFHIEAKDKESLVDTDADGINLSLKQGKMSMVSGQQKTFSRILNVAFYYNRTFNKILDKEKAIHQAGSWTMSMRPDYTLSLWPGEITEEEAEKQELIVHIHFDAKYRLDKILLEDTFNKDQADKELNVEKQQQELGIYKRADLLKMHAYKDAIRRTGGAYVLYPGTENRELRGFHEIVPGLGAFSIRPGHWSEDSIYLKQFLAEVKAHLMDRTSEREKMSYYKYDVYREPNPSMLMNSLPEPEGENRGFMPDETYVLLGYYRNEKHREWILNNNLYNTRAGERKGTINITPEIVSAKYILLHNHKDEASLWKLTGDGPRVFGFEDMHELSYPYDEPISEEDKKKTYLVFRISKKGLEKEFEHYEWNPLKIPQLISKNGLILSTIKLSELIKYAKRKENR